MTDPLWMPRSGEGMSREAGIGQLEQRGLFSVRVVYQSWGRECLWECPLVSCSFLFICLLFCFGDSVKRAGLRLPEVHPLLSPKFWD